MYFIPLTTATTATSTSTSTSTTTTIPQYTLTESASPSSEGSVTPGSGTYSSGSAVTISETPAANYHFVDWSCSGSGCYSGTGTSQTITINNNIAETANFAPDTYTITTAVSPSGTGSVSGGGTYAYGSIISLTASNGNAGVFSSWTCSGACPNGASSTANPWSVEVTGDATYTAKFSTYMECLKFNINGVAQYPYMNGTTAEQQIGGTYNVYCSVSSYYICITNGEPGGCYQGTTQIWYYCKMSNITSSSYPQGSSWPVPGDFC